jgi:prolyl-tRNA editing enzyme YbaK/EbsC (Cys-tRNA(Pro) deacylase)
VDGAAKLRAWLAEHGVEGEVAEFAASTHSVEEAAAAAGTTVDALVKSIVMVREGDGALAVAIVRGDDRASTKRVATALGAPVRLATPEEVLARTGYPAGGTPPLGFEATWLVDERVFERDVVVGGGGTASALLRISTRTLVRANGATVARVRK